MCTRCAFIAGVAAFAGAPVLASARTGDPASLEIAMPGMQRVSDTVWLGQLTPNVWVHTFTKILDGDTGYFPANGAIVVDGAQALAIDPGWNSGQAAEILDAWKRLRKPPITRAIATHFHSDRTGGIPLLRSRGIPAFGNPLSVGLAIDNELPAPKPLHDVQKKPATLGNVEIFYPGEGHTIDNIVAWVPSDRVLFGGCLVKSTTSSNLGFVGDARIGAWPETMRALAMRYPRRLHVIPGHGTVSGDSIAHTLELALKGK